MKFVIIIAASVASAGLVLPTVTQGQTSGISNPEVVQAAEKDKKLNA